MRLHQGDLWSAARNRCVPFKDQQLSNAVPPIHIVWFTTTNDKVNNDCHPLQQLQNLVRVAGIVAISGTTTPVALRIETELFL